MNINLRIFFVASLISFQTIASPIQFEDTSDKLGFTRGTETWGISWGNLNMDEFPDLWNSGHRDLPRLYQNTGDGNFDDVAMVYDRDMNRYWLDNTGRDSHGGAWGDFDNDGDDDLIVGDDNDLYTNQANVGGYFIQSNISAPQQWAGWNNTDSDRNLESDLTCGGSRGANYMLLFDLDNNGDVEKVCGAESAFPYSVSGASSSLIPSINMSNDAAIGDFNNDLRTDIIVTRGSVRLNGASKIDSNSIEAWFRSAATLKQFTFSAPGEVVFLIDGARAGPYKEATKLVLNTNGTTSASARYVSISYQSGLWKVSFNRQGEQAYVRIKAQSPVSEPVMAGLDDSDKPQATYHGVNTPSGINWVFNTGLNQPRSCVSVVAADFDNDMDLDLYMACRTSVANVSNRYFDNDGDGSFTEVPSHGGEGPVGAGTEFGVADSVITADYDVDGFMDLAVSNGLLYYPYGFGGPDTLIRNKGNGNHWIELDLIGTISPRAAIGAKVYLTTGGITQLREQSAGYHRYSQNHSRIHFGLAGNTTVDEVRIVWPTGQENSFFNIAADALYNVEENGNIIPADLTAPGPVTIEPGEECGQPPYNSRLGPVLQVWRNCGTDDWRMRIKGGLGRLAEFQDLIGEGTIVGSGVKFRSVSGSSTDSNDTVDNTPNTLIDFKLTVQADKTNEKGINFNNRGQTSTCLFLKDGNNDFERAYIGSTGKRIDFPFDFVNLGPCTKDTDGDGIIDSIDDDDDNDGVLDIDDAFPLDASESADSDADGVGDNADAFPFDPNETSDSDGDGIGDNSDIDNDNDGLTNSAETISDSDGDGVVNSSDLDSDNDTIADIVEAGLIDADGNFLIDDLNNQGSITLAPDTDGDGIPDYLDLESNNAANDGTRFDILSSVYVSFDTDNDGMLSSADINGGVDADSDGIDDLMDSNPFEPGMGPITPPPGGNSCDEPSYNSATDRAIFLWENCTTGQWEVRLSGGGDSSGVRPSGKITSTGGFNNLTRFSLESSDIVDNTTNSNEIAYQLNVWNAAVDGFGFTPVGNDACFMLDSDVPVFLGKTKVAVTSSLNLDTLASCNAPPEPAQCGNPSFDKASEPGLYLWKDCSVTGASDSWQVIVAGGGLAWSPYVGHLTATNPLAVLVATGFQLETNDTLDSVVGDNVIDFRFSVANSAEDGADISIPANSQACFEATSIPAGAQVFVGRDKVIKNGAFNLDDLGVCL